MPYFESMRYKHRLTVFGSGFICGVHQLDSHHHHYKQNKQEREGYEDQYFESVSSFLSLQKLRFMDIFLVMLPLSGPATHLSTESFWWSQCSVRYSSRPPPRPPRPPCTLTYIPYVTSVPARQLNAHSGVK